MGQKGTWAMERNTNDFCPLFINKIPPLLARLTSLEEKGNLFCSLAFYVGLTMSKMLWCIVSLTSNKFYEYIDAVGILKYIPDPMSFIFILVPR